MVCVEALLWPILKVFDALELSVGEPFNKTLTREPVDLYIYKMKILLPRQ